MIYLVLAILSSTMIAVVSRLSNKYVKNRTVMVAFNYFACSVTGFLFTGGKDIIPRGQTGMPFFIAMSVIGGAMYLCGFLLLQWNISRNGVVLPATFQKLGVLVPTALALLLFGEMPTLLQAIGFVAAIAAIVMIRSDDGKKRSGSAGLIALMLMGGSVDALGKLYEEWGNPAIKDQYLFFVFFCAMTYAIILCVMKKQRVSAWEALFGILVGVPNYLCSRFLLLSLSSVKAVVAYPTFSVGTIVCVTLIGLFFFKERLSRRQTAALLLIFLALALLNM